jgi:hypothetical protein
MNRRHLLKRVGPLALGFALASGCQQQRVNPTQPLKSFLFIGNSYTQQNNLPGLFAQLSQAGGHRVVVEAVTKGGWSLKSHAESEATQAQIRDRPWNGVILQGQSINPAVPTWLREVSLPGAQRLNTTIRSFGGQPFLFLTWGRRDGLPEHGFANFTAMQTALHQGYASISSAIKAPIIPVGLAWQRALSQYPHLQLWASDGSHPSLQGSYLSACVFYAALYQANPIGLRYPANLEGAMAAGRSLTIATQLQTLAQETVTATLEP